MAKTKEETVAVVSEKKEIVSCLRNEKVNIKFIAKARGTVQDPQHILYGGMHKKSTLSLTTPLLREGGFVNVLTKEEKDCLEQELGLEVNALSVHKIVNNFWSDDNPQGAGRVVLSKGDNIFNLADPRQYIKYKIALANKEIVCPSVQELQTRPKVTYKFVVVRDEETAQAINAKVNNKSKAYIEFGKINEDTDKLRLIIETIDGRPLAENTKIEFLQAKVGDIIEANTKLFLDIVSDSLIDTKILIRKAMSKGIVSKRGDYYYLKEDNTPLCEYGENPTLNIAAKYLASTKHQELKFSIEAKVK